MMVISGGLALSSSAFVLQLLKDKQVSMNIREIDTY